jgi:hypothetical protein
MRHLKQYYFFFFRFVLAILFLHHTACSKEYSFERADLETIPTDTVDTTISQPPITFPQCPLCNPSDSFTIGHWSFKTGNVYLCGSFTDAGFFGGFSKTAFTFFGPSACSIDTGIVVSVYLPVPLDRDRYNVNTTKTAFYYYDHNATKDIFISFPTSVFSVTVQSFIYATNIVTGTFNGTVFKANGDTAYITDGQFIAQVH